MPCHFQIRCLLALIGAFFISGCASHPEKDYNEALTYLKLDQEMTAEERFEQAVVKDPKNAEAWNQLGIIAFQKIDTGQKNDAGQKSNLSQAKTYFQEAFALDGLNPAYARNLAYVFAEEGRYGVAESLLARAADLDPSDPVTHIAIGKLRFLQNQLPEAQAAFRRVLELDPANVEAKGYLAKLDARQSN